MAYTQNNDSCEVFAPKLGIHEDRYYKANTDKIGNGQSQFVQVPSIFVIKEIRQKY